MKKSIKVVAIVLALTLVLALAVSFAACNKKGGVKEDLRFAAPEGTPALAMLTLATEGEQIGGHNVSYAAVSPSNIAQEMASKSADIVIMPVNAG
ncbi:MAG: hypothetical protein J5713_01260, partial [Clostridia bacterium]|nr:hypothetical protein [Clostridia bacterium]